MLFFFIIIFNLSGAVLVEPSYSIFDGIGFGRMSFNGFNPQIEVLNLFEYFFFVFQIDIYSEINAKNEWRH